MSAGGKLRDGSDAVAVFNPVAHVDDAYRAGGADADRREFGEVAFERWPGIAARYSALLQCLSRLASAEQAAWELLDECGEGSEAVAMARLLLHRRAEEARALVAVSVAGGGRRVEPTAHS